MLLVPSAEEHYPSNGKALFPTRLFPSWAAATHGLGQLTLDHLPDWSRAQQRAFRAWLQRGGTLRLLRRSDGQPLQLEGPLASLDDKETWGSGSVIRVAKTRFEDRAGRRGA